MMLLLEQRTLKNLYQSGNGFVNLKKLTALLQIKAAEYGFIHPLPLFTDTQSRILYRLRYFLMFSS